MDGHSLFQALDNLSQTYTQKNIQSLRKYACTTHLHIYTSTHVHNYRESRGLTVLLPASLVAQQTWRPIRQRVREISSLMWSEPSTRYGFPPLVYGSPAVLHATVVTLCEPTVYPERRFLLDRCRFPRPGPLGQLQRQSLLPVPVP